MRTPCRRYAKPRRYGAATPTSPFRIRHPPVCRAGGRAPPRAMLRVDYAERPSDNARVHAAAARARVRMKQRKDAPGGPVEMRGRARAYDVRATAPLSAGSAKPSVTRRHAISFCSATFMPALRHATHVEAPALA